MLPYLRGNLILHTMNLDFFADAEDMPAKLHTEEGTLFTNCKQCGLNLQNPPQAYSFEKVFKRYPNSPEPQVLFEYAICDNCADDVRGEFSEESLQNMKQFFEERAENISALEDETVDARLAKCVITQINLEEENEYALVARGRGDKLLVGHYPFAVSLTAMDQLSAILSEKTKDTLDDFVGKNFSGPPEFATTGPGKWVLV